MANDFPLRVTNAGYKFLYRHARRAADRPDVVVRAVLQRLQDISQLHAQLVNAVTGFGKVYPYVAWVERLMLEVFFL
jgi:hypothetical protein